MKRFLTWMLAFVMVLSLAACGGENAKKQEATDAFNRTIAIFDETIELINDNMAILDEQIISDYEQMSEVLADFKAILESDDELTDEEYDEMLAWFDEAEAWAKDYQEVIKAVIEAGGMLEETEAEAETETVEAAEGEDPNAAVLAKVVGNWALAGGLSGGVEWEDADLTSTLEMYGGVLQLVFAEDGSAQMIQGGGTLNGYFEVINEEGVGAAFDNNGTELRYICKIAEVEGQTILLVTVDQVDYMYFAHIVE